MAIKELITLEGVEEVERSLKQLGTSGEAALAEFRNLSGQGTQDALQPVAESAARASAALHETESATQRFREALHLLHPILQTAGIQFGEFRALSSAAGVGIAGLAVAITGAAIVALGKLEESLAATRGRLADLFGSQSAGQTAFAQLEKGISGLGATVSGLVPALEAAKTALDRYIATTRTFKFVGLPGTELPAGTAQNIRNVGDAVLNFFKILRAGRLDASDAEKAETAFFNTLKEGGNVTAAALKNLPTGTVQLLAEAMGRGKISAEQFIAEVQLAPIPVTKLLEALARFGPQAQSAFDTLAIKGMSDAFNELLKTVQDLFKSVSGLTFSTFIVEQLKGITEGIKTTITEFNLIADAVNKLDAAFLNIPGVKEFIDIMNRVTRAAQAFKAGAGGEGAFGGTAEEIRKAFDFSGGIGAPPDITKELIDQIQKLPSIMTGAFAGTADEITRIWDETGTKIEETTIGIKDRVDAAWASIPATFLEIWNDALSQIEGASQTQWQQVFDGAVATAQNAMNQILAIFSQPIPVTFQGFGNQPQGAPFASGGLVRGSGSGTSDSILAWLSDKEFVINARAVSHYGPDLFAALNAMRLPRDFLSRFNMGGLVRAIAGTMPHFASGGIVTAAAATAPVTFVIDRQTFDVRASDQTVAKLRRYAVASQLSSAGRKPSWVK